MAQFAWTQIVDDPAARHLVAVRLEPKAADEPAALMAALIDELAPAGDYALITRCEEEGAVMLCAFSHPTGAQSLAAALGAEDTDAYPEWASRRCFTLDHPAALAIADALAVNALARQGARQLARAVPQHRAWRGVVPAPEYRRAA